MSIKRVEKVWGEEIWIANSPLYCGKLLNVKKDFQCSYHWHPIKDETFYLLSGLIWLELNGDMRLMYPGDVVHIRPGAKHRFTGIEDSVIIEVSTQHSDDDVRRSEESGPVITRWE